MLFRALLTVLLAITLSACSSLTPEPEPITDTDISWEDHLARLQTIEAWEVTGKAGIRDSKTRHSASLAWQQQAEFFNIELTGPLGQGAPESPAARGALKSLPPAKPRSIQMHRKP